MNSSSHFQIFPKIAINSSSSTKSSYNDMEFIKFCLYFLTFSFSISSFFLFKIFHKYFCKCEICRNYQTSNWLTKFHNLSDYYTYLLENSRTQTIQIHVLDNIITSNPENVQHILKTKFDNYPKGKPFSTILGDLLGNGIFNVDGDLWMFQRKMASLVLGSNSTLSYAFEIVMHEIEFRLIPTFESKNNSVLDLQDIFKRFSFDNICKFSFGIDLNCLELSSPISSFEYSFDLATKLSAERAMLTFPLIWKIKRFLNLGSEKMLKDAIHDVNIFANEVILKRRQLGFLDGKDLLSRFITEVSDNIYLRDIIVSFILAGRDTMAAALTSLFLCLGMQPKVVSKIRIEASEILGKNNQEFASIEQIRSMYYLHAVVYESLRLYPPVQFDSKFAVNDDVLPDGTVVRKGTRVTYHPYAMGRMKTIWGSDCMEFKPERWLKNGRFCPQNLFKFTAFQAGIRVCLGKELAIVEMKSITVSVLCRFDFEVVGNDDDVPRFGPGLTATVKGGVQVMVRERKF